MTSWHRHDLPLDAPFPPGLARLLLEVCGDDLPSALVVLPAVRACGSLRHALLEASGADGLLLPRLTTPGRLAADLALRLGIDDAPAVPHRLRAAVLAPRLATVAWVRERPGAAAGLAEELVRLFDELRRHGLEVDHHKNPGCDLLYAALDQYERIFVNFYVISHQRTGSIRLTGPATGSFWRGFYANAPDKVVFTSFGNPYVLHEQPHLNNLLLAYGPYAVSQRAAVRAWLGEITPAGVCPVRLPKVQVRRFPLE